MTVERELERRLREMPVPEEGAAEERAREVIRAAYAERTPAHARHRPRRLALALAGAAALLAIGLSPAGAKVADLVSDVIGEEDAKPVLRSLPAAGELLVESENGPWIVREDGSKRLLGDYDQATWSPRGWFVAAADGRELIVVDPSGNPQWTHPAPGRISDPRWSGTELDTRIAYRSGDDLRVIGGGGENDRLVARDIAPVAPVWRPIPASEKLEVAPGGGGVHVLTFLDGKRNPRTVDADSRQMLRTTSTDLERLSDPRTGAETGRALSPSGRSVALVRQTDGRAELVVSEPQEKRPELLFSGPGHLTGPIWSPDGRWLLVGWREADQWLFIRVDRPRRTVAFDNITRQFDPGDNGEARFPRVSDWVLPNRPAP